MLTKIKTYLDQQAVFYVITVIKQGSVLAKYAVQTLQELPYNLRIEAIENAFQKQRTALIQQNDIEIFLECVHHNPSLYIFGGGTVALPLCQIATMTGFSVTIIDDRKEFANKDRFPWAEHIICDDMEKVLTETVFPSGGYYVLVTRGHQMDELCLRAVLKKDYHYIGMIGSKRKSAMMKATLRKEGVPETILDQIHAPIGLPIHSHTPAEIAVSICAQLIQIKNEAGADEGDMNCWKQVGDSPAVMATIMEHQGSTPRGIGSKMLIREEGSIVGSIGGGSLEYKTIERAKILMHHQKSEILNFNLSNEDASKEGMICGGSARVLLEPVALFDN